MPEKYAFVEFDDMENFMKDVFMKMGVPEDDAEICADVLITSDKRGIDSHGCGRLYMYYVRLKRGQQLPITDISVEKESLSIARLNAHNGMGQPASRKAMEIAIDKAKRTGIGLVTVGQSNHFGIAGYYCLMAAEEECIGICGTNARPSIAPTWSVEPMLGTNPLSIGIPTDWDFPWIADHATSITQRGKIETYARLGKKAVAGWVINEDGKSTTDTKQILKDLLQKKAALTPLGGIGEELGGHKGYNYATFVEIMSAALSQANFLQACLGLNENGESIPFNLGHFFIAIDPSKFIEIEEFKKITGEILSQLASAKRSPDADHIYIAGEKEYLAYEQRISTGIPVSEETQRQMLLMARECGLNVEDYGFEFKVEIDMKASMGW